MEIAVLFGSFSPLTIAHISMLKSAVKSLNADKGFSFVPMDSTSSARPLRLGTRSI